MAYLADLVPLLLEGSRVGLVTYGTDVVLNIPFINEMTTDEMVTLIQTTEPPSGSTFTKFALEDTLENVWTSDVLGDTGRSRITMLFTDGRPTVTQDPCGTTDGNDPQKIKSDYEAEGKSITLF